ncbi:hypothetical protein [Microbacterium plantarum]|uniref:hypothetical protein n=1 Tax=Microbacterium plantarum TaxID=1816425 RepID=UPI002B4653E3|nr:hypothetical protein [Microbacterium plantarum]WRK17965.1 hypothetical protein VC184_02810 [Microbacterium plantarum]
MTTTPPPFGAPEAQPAPYYPPQPAGVMPTKQRNIVGIVALAISAVGFIFACVPAALILGWILLPAGFILGIVAVCLSGRVKWQALTAIIVSVVGTIVGFLVFTFVVATALSDAVDEATGGSTTVNEAPAGAAPQDETADEATSDAPTGTREDPLPFSASISNNDWDVILNSFERNGNDAVMAGNSFNTEPGEGTQYVILDMTATYKGSGDGSSALVQVEYVAADGTVISTWDNFVSGVEPTFGTASLLAGASDTGKQVYLVPSSLDGLIRVTPGILADEVYFQLP